MKKIVLVLVLLVMAVPVVSFSAGLFPADLLTLSKKVSGSYFINSGATEYSLSTGHKQGDKVFATSSNDSLIYYKQLAKAVTFASSDLLQSHNGNFASVDDGFDKN